MKRIALLGIILPLLLAFTYGGDGSNGFSIGESFSPSNANEIDTALDNLEAGTSLAAGITRDIEWDTVGEVETAWGGVNIILGTEIDTAAELNALTTDTDMLLATDLGTTVQAYDADLADLADGSLSGSKIGTGLDAAVITTGTIASTARLPSAVIESTEIDTSGELNAIILDTDFLTATATANLNITGTAIFSGTLQGGVSVNMLSGTTASPIAGSLLGYLTVCTNAAGCDITLPTAAAGQNACFRDGNGGGLVTLDAAAGDEIELDGVGVGVADAIDSAGNKGDFICILAIDDTTWVTLGRSGTWVDGGAD